MGLNNDNVNNNDNDNDDDNDNDNNNNFISIAIISFAKGALQSFSFSKSLRWAVSINSPNYKTKHEQILFCQYAWTNQTSVEAVHAALTRPDGIGGQLKQETDRNNIVWRERK